MPQIAYTPDGKYHMIFGDKDAFEVIEQYAGEDVKCCVMDLIKSREDELKSEIEELKYDIEDMEYDFDVRRYDLEDKLDSAKSAADEIEKEASKPNPDMELIKNKAEKITTMLY